MMSNALTGGIGAMPTTSFGQPAVNPMMNPALTGGLPQTSFGTGVPAVSTLPQTTFGATASMPNLNSGITGGGFQPQSSFGVNQLSNMFANTSIQQPMQQQMPTTSFGAAPMGGFQPQQQQPQPLMSQATGMGFGNSAPGGLTTQATGFGFGNSPMPQTSFGGPAAGGQPQQQGLMGQATGRRANLANATADNPFGF
ncbi:unnamed protein product [Ambrosiozyma monospora]|uniref:Unnamed protein product n=1 Tax=Ambrosiozyma monospora TaxID=43982 RepID=A0ACB5U6I1_AMBMO|nr:unnamed protein product [Ambrosiozyma monospora]